MLAEAEKYPEEAINRLEPGTFVNSCTMISPKTYLEDYMLVFDGSLPEKDRPIIATLSQTEFKESLLNTDDLFVEKLYSFSKHIPGFQSMSRSSARKLFYLFTQQKVQKGWQMLSADELMARKSS